MRPMLRVGARFAGKLFSTAYHDLLLDSNAMDGLCDTQNLQPLGRFRHRMLYQCGRADHLVGFETGGLFVPQGGVNFENFPPRIAGFQHVHQALLLEPFPESGSANASGSEARVVLQVGPTGVALPSKVLEEVQLDQCAAAFSGFDCWSGRDTRAAQMLTHLRAVGQWTMHVVDFPEIGVIRHGAIIAHPNFIKNPGKYGDDVAEHLAKEVSRRVGDTIHSAS